MLSAPLSHGLSASQPQSLSSQVNRRLTVLHVDPVPGLARKIRLGLLAGRPLVEQLCAMSVGCKDWLLRVKGGVTHRQRC